MRTIIINCLFIGLLFGNTNILSAQVESKIEMTPAEYQNLMETILQAKKKRMAKRRYYYQMQMARTTTSQDKFSSTNAKIEELESVYSKLTEQQKSDSSNTADLERVKAELNREMEQLRTQLREEQNENRNLTDKYEERSSRGEEELMRRNKWLEEKINTLNSKQYAQQQEYQKLQRELEKLNNRLDKMAKKEVKTDVASTTESEKQISELTQKVKEIEKQQSTLLIIKENESSNGTTNTDVDPAYVMAFSKQLAELEVKMEDLQAASKKATQNRAQKNQIKTLEQQIKSLEKKISTLPTNYKTPNIPDYSKQINDLQAKLRELQAYHHSNTHTAPPVVISTPAPKEDIRSFVTSRRQQNVYFQNGAASLTTIEQNKIQEVASWLSTYDRLDITIKGYASNTGSLETNQRLSQQRAQFVKQALLNLGVRADRIILEPLGIDTASADPANARRAEIHLLIRN